MEKYQSYKQSGVDWIGDIPIGWDVIKGKYILKILTGNYPSEIIEDDDGKYFIKVDDLNSIEDNFYLSNPKLKIKDFGVNTLDEGIILFPKRGMTIFTNKVVITKSRSFIDPNLMGIKVFESFNKIFLFYLLTNRGLGDICDSSTIPQINNKHIYPLEFIKPPLCEQHQIVQFLDEKTELIDKIISTKERKITLLKEQRTTLINEVITKGLNPNVKMKDSGVEWIGEIPEGWKMVRVSNFGTFFKGNGIKKDEVKDEGIPCIRYGEIYTKYERIVYYPISFIDLETSKNSVQIKKGDILFTGSGETLVDIGKSVLYYGEENIFVGGDIIVLRLKEGNNPLYLSYLLNSSFVQYQKSLMGRGEIIVHIYSKNIKEIKTPIPPLKEQLQIVEHLDSKTKEIDDLVQLEQQKIDLLKEYRQSLISEVVTGKVKVTQ